MEVEPISVGMKYFAALKEITGKREDHIQLREGANVREALRELVRMNGEKFASYVMDEKGGLKPGMALLVNGGAVKSEAFDTTLLKEGDVLVILPPISGGTRGSKAVELLEGASIDVANISKLGSRLRTKAATMPLVSARMVKVELVSATSACLHGEPTIYK